MRLVRTFVIICVALSCGLCSSALAGGEAGQTAIGFLVTDVSPTIALRFWVDEHYTIDLDMAVSRVSPEGSSHATRLQPGLGLSYHWNSGQKMRPYIGLRGGLDRLSNGDQSFTDVLIGPTIGAEYFLSERFSVAGEYQLIFVTTDDDFSPGFPLANATYIQTAEVLSVHFYIF